MNRDISNMNATEYKKYHESFMENNHGSSAWHTFLCIFFTVQCSLYCCLSKKCSEPVQYVYEYILIVLPLILAHTVYTSHIYFLNCVILTMLLIKFKYHYHSLQIHKTFTTKNCFRTNKVLSISCLRGLTYLITVFAILAVDFRSFPRYLAKTETYGYSLMDTGVGLFVLMSGLVHKDLRNEKIVTILKGNIKFISILIFLGIGRFVSIKQLDYQEHVTEYGVHWNFFFTLAVCKTLSTVILYYCPNTIITSIVILAIHEYFLYSGLEEWVFSDIPRTNLLHANREGLASCLGYVSLYLFAAHIKSVICNKSVTRYNIQMRFITYIIVLCCLAFISNFYRKTSRTLANSGYCFYLEAVLVVVLTVIYFLEVQFQTENTQFELPLILSAINSNGLIYFLVSNLLTGAINLSIKTLSVSLFGTFLILNIYMVLTILLVVYFKKKGITM